MFLRTILAALGTLAFTLVPVSLQASSGDDASEIRALEQTFASGMNAKDIDTVMSVYEPGKALFVFDVVGPPDVHAGWSEYRKAFEGMFESIDGPLHFTMSDFALETSGDVAYSRSLQQVAGVRKVDGKAFDYTVRVSDVYRKIAGRWLIVQEHLSLPIDRSTFAPMLHTSLSS